MILKTLPVLGMLCSFTATAQPSAAISDSAAYFFRKAIEEKNNGHTQESFRYLEKAAGYDAGNKEIIAGLAATSFELRRYPQSREYYKKLNELGDNSAATYKQLLNLSYNLRQQEDVVLYATKLKEADPAEKVSFFIGKANYEQENYGDAIRHLSNAAKEDPQNAEVPYMIARSYADMQNYKQSIPYFTRAIELDTSKNNWMYELGLIYYAMHEDKNSLKYMLMAGEKGYKRDNEYLENLGIAYLNAGELEQGVGILGEILRKRPSDMNILNMVAEAYYFKGKYQEAMDYWDKMLEYDKQNASALYMIGMCYQKKGEKAKGQQLCDKAIEMDPDLASLKQKKQMPGGL